jgi:hypothetical protein
MKRPVLMFTITLTVLLMSLCILFLARSPRIPNTIRDEEYGLYSEWTVSHFLKNPPKGQLFLLSRTFKFDPREHQGGCGHPMIEKAEVPGLLISQLSDIGDVEYVFDANSAHLRIPWKYTFVGASPDLPPGTFHLLAFSRAAFSRDHKEALFAVSDACAAGDCGAGGVVYAHKQHGSWAFQSTSCLWLY